MARPDACAAGVWDIDIGGLLRLGVRGCIVDLDNTIAPWNCRDVADKARYWLSDARAAGLCVCILSNNHAGRVRPVADALRVEFLCDAKKPSRRAFWRAADLMGVPREACVVIGDQYFTDVVGGHRAGMRTVLVRPLHTDEFIGTRAVRPVERLVLAALHVRR